MTALLPHGALVTSTKVAEEPPRKVAGPWELKLHPEHGGIWVRPYLGCKIDGEQEYVAAVAWCAELRKAWWAASDDDDEPIGSLGMGWVESVDVGKTLADTRLLTVGWTLQL